MTASPALPGAHGPTGASHVYFDFFGTLVDYDPSVLPETRNAPHEFAVRAGAAISAEGASSLWQRAWTELDEAAESSGRECSMHEIAGRYAGLLAAETTTRDSVGGTGGSPHETQPAHPAHEIDRLVTDYLDAWTSGIRLADSARECLRDLERDHTLAVVSNTHHAPLVPQMLSRFGIAEFFSDVFTSIELGWRKPRPEVFAAVLGAHGASASTAVFVGDNWQADVAGPTAAGMRALYVGKAAPGRVPVTLAEVPALVRGGSSSAPVPAQRGD